MPNRNYMQNLFLYMHIAVSTPHCTCANQTRTLRKYIRRNFFVIVCAYFDSNHREFFNFIFHLPYLKATNTQTV